MNKIAIIGMGCLFPDAETPEEYWKNLLEGKDSVSKITEQQLGRSPEYYFDPSGKNKDKYYSKYGGFIQNFSFDSEGYKLDLKTLEQLDVLYHWSLYVTKEALKDAGYYDNSESLKRCGVVLGNLSFPTQKSHQKFMPLYSEAMEHSLKNLLQDSTFELKDPTLQDHCPTNAQISGYPAALVAQALGLEGGHLSMDAACASSFYSLKSACAYLNFHKADMMLAGAVSAAEPWFVSAGFSVFQALAKENNNAPFEKTSDGLLAGQGAGMVVLKRYDDAVRDNDNILAVIRGVEISNDGRGLFPLRPNAAGQITCFERAYKRAGVAPSSIEYIECHATGTPLGDTTELNSMERFFGDSAHKLRIGSAKSNFGHLLSSAGIASLLKVILALKHDTIPPTIKIKNPVSSDKGLLGREQMITEPTLWKIKAQARRIGVSAFGFGGTNAHLILEEYRREDVKKRTLAEKKKDSEKALSPLSIVGMSSLFGGCQSLDELTNLIFHAKTQSRDLPEYRWKGMEKQSTLLKNWGLTQGKAPSGNYLESFDFDYLHYKIPPVATAPLLPQQLLLLHVADKAIQDAGLKEGSNVAVLVAMESDLGIHHFRGRSELGRNLRDALAGMQWDAEEIEALVKQVEDSFHNTGDINQITSFIGNIMATRVNSLWDFSGPAFTISSEENSTSRALELAQMILSQGEAEAVVVGAVDLCGGLEHVIHKNAEESVSSHNEPQLSFEVSNQGWFVGEGAGVIVLKREDDAEKAQDRIYANIDAIATQTGEDSESIKAACQSAWKQAGIGAESIEYIEAHASGFSKEDRAESKALLEAYHNSDSSEKNVALGSIKSNIGHTFAASGIASVIKTALCLHHRFIPGIPNWQSPKDKSEWQQSSFYFPTESQPWFKNQDDPIRRAAINVIGSETSAHLVLSEAKNSAIQTPSYFHYATPHLFPVSANSDAEFQEELQELLTFSVQNNSLALVAKKQLKHYEKQLEHGKKRYILMLIAPDAKSLAQEIQAAQSGCTESIRSGKAWSSPQGSYFTPKPLAASQGKIAFTYPGGYNSYVGMGKHPFFLFPELFELMEQSTSRLKDYMKPEYLYPRTVEKISDQERKIFQNKFRADDIAMFETGIFQSMIYTHVMREKMGIDPEIAFGNSMGELSMMFSMGAWRSPEIMSQSLVDLPTFSTRLVGAMDLAREAWGLPAAPADTEELIWGTYSLQISPEEAQPVVDEEERVFLTMINTPNNLIIAGDRDACDRVRKKLGCHSFEVPVGDIVHNELLTAEFDNLRKIHTQEVFPVEGVDFYAALNYEKTKLDTETIANNITEFYGQCLDFPTLVQKVYEDGARIFIELGPRNNCSFWVSECLKNKEHLSVSMDALRLDEPTTLVQCIAKLMSHHVPLNLDVLHKQRNGEPVEGEHGFSPVSIGKAPFSSALLSEENRKRFLTSLQSPKTQEAVAVVPEAPKVVVPVTQATAEVQKPVAPIAPAPVTPVQSIPVASKTAAAPVSGQGVERPFFKQLSQVLTHSLEANSIHSQFLEFRKTGLLTWAQLLHQEMKTPAGNVAISVPVEAPNLGVSATPAQVEITPEAEYLQHQYTQKDQDAIWDHNDLLEFAKGKISNVFGEEYAIIDTYSRRVMLPMPPYLLVHRITELNATINEYKPCSITTEYDIPYDSWHSTDGSINTAICIESGQCDLMLISYLGIDFQNKGECMYRLLDCSFTYFDNFPREGETLRYEISINSFAHHGSNLLFFFSYECLVGTRLVMKMTGGCAGFFSDADLSGGKGVVYSATELKKRAEIQKQRFTPLLQCAKTTFDRADLSQLIHKNAHGSLEACFGANYTTQGQNPSLRFPSDRMLMLDRITSVHTQGAPWGLGEVWAEKDLAADDWYFPCHFKGDEVLAGSLIAEGAMQLLQFYMLYLGLHTQTQNARFQPLKEVTQVVRCRGQVLPNHGLMKYRMEVVEIKMTPVPHLRANVDILLGDLVVMDVKDLGLELIESVDVNAEPPHLGVSTSTIPPVEMAIHGVSNVAPVSNAVVAQAPKPEPLYNEAHIQAFATGLVHECFGENFKIYEHRRAPRTPNGYLQFISRVNELHGTKRDFKKMSWLISEYDVPEDIWFYTKNASSTVPYSVIMEIALQPNGFLCTSMESTLLYPDLDFSFRNLDGTGELYKVIDLRGKTVVNKSELLSTSASGATIIQRFTFELSCDEELFYKGTAVFGYFTSDALANQLGMDKGACIPAWYEDEKLTASDGIEIVVNPSLPYYQGSASNPNLRLSGGMLEFLDRFLIFPEGGKYKQGYVFASKEIDSSNWFYPCHFHKDPVMPGSLGVEAMLESIQTFALQQNIGASFNNAEFTHVDAKTRWIYRGQIVHQSVKIMTLEVHIKSITHHNTHIDIVADGNLWRDGLRIYELHDLGVRIQAGV